MRQRKGFRLWIVLLACGLVVLAIRYTAGGFRQGQPVIRFTHSVFAPLQEAVSRPVSAVRDAVAFLIHLGDLRKENAALRHELDRLTLRQMQMEELRQENLHLRDLMEFQGRRPWLGDVSLHATRVTARNPDDWFSVATVDLGERDGVRKGLIAVTTTGLAGRVVSVTGRSAVILLLTDPQSGVGAMVQRETSRAQGVVLGQAGRGDLLKMRFFQRNADVRRGELIVTSALGDNYPAGIPIGKVAEVFEDKDGLIRYAWVEPVVDFDRLERLFLVPSSLAQADTEPDGRDQGE